jgi:hypothetical protein
MNNKHLEYIIIYLSVAIACVAIAALVRISALGMGFDEFTANTIFWAVAGLGLIAYCVLTLTIQGLLDKTAKLFFSKPKKIEEEPETANPPSLDEIRTEKQKQLDEQYAEKLKAAIRYTQEILAPYVSDTNMDVLCKNVEIYAAGNDLENITIQPVRVKELTTTDICHFGWNIWNHFDVTDQWEISRFLKTVFEEKLKGIEIKTIKKKLKIFEPNSTIQIQESLKI